MKIGILFVCLGNICRSPMAEAIFRSLVQELEIEDQFDIDSAGTGDWHIGDGPHQGTVQKLAEHNISTEGMYSRQLRLEDYDRFDYIVCMDNSNIENALPMLGQPESSKVFRLLDLLKDPKDVPDPYFTGDFEETYQLCVEGCKALLQKIKEDGGSHS
ncbi:low molecular weight protein-tyrosine-phosphatase [Rummeliibacillus suwonensis]|uniref:low molecular weight protein-tyrosine-phosphatase n=1 Tax=Rummeliibacillus suwonensis TaxID=1306154 RepID=UPI001AB01913|nr:low molecular weight protein-tyrosine-phosphatase [Rummeliibacillus suwonensis]MBO2536822.1 low molecular weight phosphotyrosine protein phosphatase [Rummeliibacillus suwonensis]